MDPQAQAVDVSKEDGQEPVAARTRSKTKRKFSEEQLTVLKERLAKARENKQKKREELIKAGKLVKAVCGRGDSPARRRVGAAVARKARQAKSKTTVCAA